jgi:Porin PorA
MRRAFGVVLIGVGVFALAMTILLPTVVVSQSKKTPLDLDITQISSGPAKVLDAATGKTNDAQLRATRIVRTDSAASDDKNTTVNETLCIVVVQGKTPNCVPSKDPRLLSFTTDRVTSDRRSADSVHVAGWGENVNGDTSVRHEGMTYKWPIDTEKKDYKYYENDLKLAVTAKYEGTAKRKGLEVYKFVASTGDHPYLVQGIAKGTYNDVTTAYVEPITGAVIDGSDHQVQKLANGTLALDTTLSFDKSAIDYQAKYSQDEIDKLHLAQIWGPIIAGVIGIAALIGAYFLLRRRNDGGGSGRHHGSEGDDGGGYSDSDDGPVLAGSSSQT